MPDQPSHPTSRDFAFQTADQAYSHTQLGGDGAPQPAYSTQRPLERYEVEQGAGARGVLATPDQAPVLGTPMRYMDYDAPENPEQQQGAPADFPGYDFHQGAWDWNNSSLFTEFANHYEPQGELVHELQNQNISNDFTIPLPVNKAGSVNQSPKPTPSTTTTAVAASAPATTVQNPLSPPPKPPPKPTVQTGIKRKADSEPNSAVSQSASLTEQKPAKRPNRTRTSSNASATSPIVASSASAEIRPPPMTASATALPSVESAPPNKADSEVQKRREQSKGTGPQGRVIDVSKPRRIVESPDGPHVLPAGKVFPIQIGSELFRLSGASLSSDAPSYFSHFFGDQVHNMLQGSAGDIRTLYIDRDPDTFRDIALHLQGYHIKPRDGEHFVRLFADAQFYSLPRLTKQLFSTDIFVRIGGTPFQIPRDLFSSPGDSPNYFSLGFAQFFSTPSEVFPGLDRNALLRPPSISPPSVPNRNGELFGELVKLLQGYNIEIRNEEHRSQLLRDARYFHLKGLEQKLIPCDISYNLKRGQNEILVRLDDIRQSGVSFSPDTSNNSGSGSGGSSSTVASIAGFSPDIGSKHSSPSPSLGGPQFKAGTVCYARPYTDDHAGTNILILETSSAESTVLHFPVDSPLTTTNGESPTLNMRATFHGSTLARITSLFSVVASKMGLPATQPLGLMMLQSGGGVAAQPVSPANSGVSERRVRVRLSTDCSLELDNGPAELAVDPGSGRIGIRRVHSEHRNKRFKYTEENGEPGPDSVDAHEWVWGGAKEAYVKVSKDGEEVGEELVVRRAQWRLRVEPVEGEGTKMQVVLCGVKLDGYCQERSRNTARGFLA